MILGIRYALLLYPVRGISAIRGIKRDKLRFTGLVVGKKAGAFFGRYAQLAGGFVLILLGVRILVTHLLAE